MYKLNKEQYLDKLHACWIGNWMIKQNHYSLV